MLGTLMLHFSNMDKDEQAFMRRMLLYDQHCLIPTVEDDNELEHLYRKYCEQ